MPQFMTMAIPTRLPLVVDTSNRDGSTSKDARLVNCFTEVNQQQGVQIYKRPGTLQQAVVSTNSPGLGIWTWNNNVYSIFNVGASASMFKNGVQVATGMNNTAPYTFSSVVGSTPKMVLQNGPAGYAYSDGTGLSATLNSINNVYPAYNVPGLVYLDGYMYVMQHLQGTSVTPAVIWESNLNSVDVAGDWNALNFITAQIEPDPGVFLAKQLVYVIAGKQWSTEVFYDAGNASGSSLAPVQEAKQPYGCANAYSLQSINDSLLWLSQNQSASLQVVMMQNLRLAVVSTPAIERLLQNASLTTVRSLQMKINGHNFYILNLISANLTLVYDIAQNQWSQWTDENGNYFPFVGSTYDGSGNHILQHVSNGALYYANSTYLTDNNLPISVDIYTPIFDAGTRRRKQMNYMQFIADQVPAQLQVRVSDDDYQTWSNARNVDLSHKIAFLSNCGSFTKRAFHLNHTANTEFRISAVEMQFDIGTL